MKLYSYFRSSASYRVRIALNLKGLMPEIIPVNLLKGEQKAEAYRRVNPQQLVPSLVEDGQVLTQSLAIMEYLDEQYPVPPLLPQAPLERARVRALAQAIACEMAPLNNVGVLQFLTQSMGVSDEGKMQWYRHWVSKGFEAVESLLASGGAATYCHGASPTLADCCLVPQVYNARRFNCDLSPYPLLTAIAGRCDAHPAFAAAHPSRQLDAPPEPV
jgi:maleylacetoacetate isomerase